MDKFSTGVIYVLFLISCNANTATLSVRDFTTKYADSLTARFPSATFTIADDSTIVSKMRDYDVRISVDNAYREYLAEPASLTKVLSKYINVSSELYNPHEKINVNRIIPIIKPVEYFEDLLNAAQKMGKGKDVEGVCETYNDQLVIAYAEDTKNSIRYLTRDDLKTLSIKMDSLRPIAVSNLDKLLAGMQRAGGEGVFMLTAGGDYETSIILLNNVFTKERLPVHGDFIIAIPNRDMLLVTGSNDKAGLLKIKEVAKKSFDTGTYQVSPYLYKWTGQRFEKYDE